MIELTKVTYDEMVAAGKVEVDEDGTPTMEGLEGARIPVRLIDDRGLSPDMTAEERLDRVMQRAVTAMKATMVERLGPVRLSFVVIGELEGFRRECSVNPEEIRKLVETTLLGAVVDKKPQPRKRTKKATGPAS